MKKSLLLISTLLLVTACQQGVYVDGRYITPDMCHGKGNLNCVKAGFHDGKGMKKEMTCKEAGLC